MTVSNLVAGVFTGLALLALAGCSSSPQGSNAVSGRDCDPVRDARCQNKIDRVTTGSIADLSGSPQYDNITFGDGQPLGRGTSVNKHLWTASLDTLSFLPISSTDPFTGVIATDWSAAPNTPNERLKVTAYVRNTTLTAEALRVAVFREELGENGVWVAAPVDEATPRQLEDAILTRARQLRRDELQAEDES